jgi:ABC-2 type transport system ATP-binding protein
MPSGEPAILCRGLIKRYGELIAVNGLDLRVETGECFGLLGPNGAGKTTTVEILEGLTPPDGGTVELLGTQWSRRRSSEPDRALQERLGIQLQETQFSEKMTVQETICMFRSFFQRGHSVDEVIARVSLDEKRHDRVGRLSGGQRQRLAVACALVNEPDLLFLDEPTTGLDPQARLNLWEVVADFRARGRTVLLTTHYMEEAERLCDRVAIMDHGRVIALGTPDELIASLGANQVIEFSINGELQQDALASLPGAHEWVARGTVGNPGYLLTVEQTQVTLPALFAEIERQGRQLTALTTHRATLEDVFVKLTGRALRDA